LAWPVAALATWIGLAVTIRYLRRHARRAAAKTAAAGAKPAQDPVR
jgi:hypothetical protein